MFLTQIWGTILGGFINYAVMISIVGSNRALLKDGDGNSSWSGATMQSYNTNATSWALAGYLYKLGGTYELVPFGLLVGASLVIMHRIFYKVSFPKSSNLDILLIPPSSTPRSRTLMSRTSTFLSSSSSLVISPTTRVKLASSSASCFRASSFNSISETTAQEYSGTIHTW
jgi:hypothetical protein